MNTTKNVIISALFTALVQKYFVGIDCFTEWLFVCGLCFGSVLFVLAEIDRERKERKRLEKKKRIHSDKVRRWNETFGYVVKR